MFKIVAILAAVMLLAALLPWPYGYYQVLRLAVFASGIYCGVAAKAKGNDKLAYSLFAASLAFNPFLPMHLPREVWSILNVIGAGIFGYAAMTRSPEQKPSKID